MNNYEMIIIIDPSITEEHRKATLESVLKLIELHGTITNVEEWGEKKLAYPMQNKTSGYYVIIDFSMEQQFVEEVERRYHITTEIIKHIIVRKD